MISKRAFWIKTIALVLGLVLFFAIWYILAYCLKQSGNTILPYPHETFIRAFELLFMREAVRTWYAIGNTTWRVVLGFAISFLLGGLLGTLSGLFKFGEFFFKPGVGIMRSIPTAAVVIVLLGMLFTPKTLSWLNYVPCMLTFIVAFPLIYEAFRAGIASEDKEVVDALSIDAGKRSLRGTWKVLLPDAWPFVALAIAQSFGLSFKTAIMAEVLNSSNAASPGIGTMILLSRQTGDLDGILAYALISLAVMAVVDIPWLMLKHLKEKKDEVGESGK